MRVPGTGVTGPAGSHLADDVLAGYPGVEDFGSRVNDATSPIS